MQFLRTIFWVIVAVAAVVFAFGNWISVPVNIWANLIVDVKLPVLVIGAFLAGLIPPLILYRTTVWRYRKRLERQQRELDAARLPPPPPPPAIEDEPAAVPPLEQAEPAPARPVLAKEPPAPLPPAAYPSAVPPNVA